MPTMDEARERIDTFLRTLEADMREAAELDDGDDYELGSGNWMMGDWVLVVSWVPVTDVGSSGYTTHRVRGPMTPHHAAMGLLHVALNDIG